jgi:hypothetical protein
MVPPFLDCLQSVIRACRFRSGLSCSRFSHTSARACGVRSATVTFTRVSLIVERGPGHRIAALRAQRYGADP